jgi:nicotinamide-nucleotide amidase
VALRCDVLAVGTELLLGQIIDSNSAWIGGELAASGID